MADLTNPTKPGDRVTLSWWNGKSGALYESHDIQGTVFTAFPWDDSRTIDSVSCTVLLDRPLRKGVQTVTRISWCGFASVDGKRYSCTKIEPKTNGHLTQHQQRRER